MNEEKEIENSEKAPREVIVLTELSSQKVNFWIEQAKSKKKGVKISRKEFANWLIEKMPDSLSNSDLNAIVDKFYDEEAFLRQLLRDVKKAKKEGQAEPALEFTIKMKKIESKKEENPDTPNQVND